MCAPEQISVLEGNMKSHTDEDRYRHRYRGRYR